MTQTLARYSKVLEIVGDILKVRVPRTAGERKRGIAFDDLALVEDPGGLRSLARVIRLDRDVVSLQVFAGTKGLSTEASVQFLGHPMRVTYSPTSWGGCSAAPASRWTADRICPRTRSCRSAARR